MGPLSYMPSVFDWNIVCGAWLYKLYSITNCDTNEVWTFSLYCDVFGMVTKLKECVSLF